jgi:hypothetical protein
MSTLETKPRKVRILNTRLPPIAALLLVLLALLFLAAPLIRTAGGTQRAGNFVLQANGQSAAPNGVPATPAAGVTASSTTRRVAVGGGSTIIFIYFAALLISLAAALGMLFTKRWGQVLAIIMGVIYGLFGLVSLLPLLFGRVVGAPNPVSLILGVVQLLLAVAVIVLASIPGKPGSAPVPAAASPSA